MNYKFVQVDGETEDVLRTWVLTPPVSVGRGMLNHISIDDGSISRRHCEFLFDPNGSLVVRDVGSKNGILIDGKLMDKAVICPGLKIQIGLVHFRVEQTDEEPHSGPKEAYEYNPAETEQVQIYRPSDDRYDIG